MTIKDLKRATMGGILAQSIENWDDIQHINLFSFATKRVLGENSIIKPRP